MAFGLTDSAQLRINVAGDVDKFARKFAHLEPANLKKRFAIALNKTAGQARSEVSIEMTRVFDRPTRYTMNSLRLKPATAARPQAELTLRESSGGNTPASAFLGPQIAGGRRDLKPWEKRFFGLGRGAAQWQIVPGPAMKLDAFGNIPRGEIVRILAYFERFREAGSAGNTTPARRAKLKKGTKKQRGFELFIVFPGAKAPAHGGKRLHPGVWKRSFTAFGAAIQPLLFFVRPPLYRARLDFPGIVQRVVARDLDGNLADAFSRASAASTT